MRDLLSRIFRPIRTVSSKEGLVFWVSFIASCVFGQIAILGGVMVATDKGITIAEVLKQNLLSANMYTFAIALLASACTLLLIELHDNKNTPDSMHVLTKHKIGAGFIAMLLILMQGMAASSLIKESLLQVKVVATTAPVAQSFFDATNFLQLILWVLSMVVAQYLFCLTRMHRYPEEIVLMVQAKASQLAGHAHGINTTSSGEKL